jgi:hypothetical protein
MATSNAQRFLAANGVDNALALEMFFGLVLEGFYSATMLWNAVNGQGGIGGSFPSNVVQSKTVSSGKSWQFVNIADGPEPITHTPGTELLGQNYAFDEGSVTIDGILVGHHDVPLDQIMQAHWDVLGPLAKGIGRRLASNFDRRLFVIAVKAALTAARTKDGFTVHNGGNVVDRVAAGHTVAYPVSATGARNFRDDCDQLAYLMNVDNVPEEGRYLAIDPYIGLVLQQDVTLFDPDYSRNNQNSMNDNQVKKISGFTLLGATNNLPTTVIGATSLGGNLPAKYHFDGVYNGTGDGRPVAVALCGADEGRAAIGYVAAATEELGPIHAVLETDNRRNTKFMKGQMMVGADVLSPACAGVIMVDDS